MFQRFPLFALALALLMGLSQTVWARDTAAQAAARKQIMAVYNRMDEATKKIDVDAMMAYIAPDFRAYSKNYGEFDREGYRRVMGLMKAAQVRVLSSSTDITKIQWRGPDAIVWVKSGVRMSGPRGTIVANETTRHYWGKINGQWQLRQEVTIDYSSTLNGKRLR